MTDIPGMIIWTGDYLADTTHLTTFEHGAYDLILIAMWRSGGKLANDSKKLAMLAKTTPDKWQKIEKKIMSFMTLLDGDDYGYMTQKRLRQEYRLAQSRNMKRVEAGRMGGMAKALKSNKFSSSNATYNGSNGKALPGNTNSNIYKDSFNGEIRQESRWIPTKRIGSRLFKAGELAPAYDGQPADRWKKLRPEDCI